MHSRGRTLTGGQPRRGGLSLMTFVVIVMVVVVVKAVVKAAVTRMTQRHAGLADARKRARAKHPRKAPAQSTRAKHPRTPTRA